MLCPFFVRTGGSMRTPLYDEHLKLGARMTEFAGWEMPLQYTGIAHEVSVVRSAVGLFDISHMGEFIVSGPHALDLIQYIITNDASALEVGAAQYTLMCDQSGGPIDDLIVYRIGDDEYLVIVNASNEKSDYEWITSHNPFGARISNQSAFNALIAVQGPRAEDLVARLAAFNVRGLSRFHIRDGIVAGLDCRLARTGYTGEDGFEVLCSVTDAVKLWMALIDAGAPMGVEAIGLGARDVLRLEAAYPLYGHELTRETSPVAARLMWVVKPDKGDFVGRSAILGAKKKGTDRTLVGLEAIDRCIPRHGCDIVSHDTNVGSVTSGTFSPTLNKAIALAYVDRELAQVGTDLSVVTGGRTCACRVAPTPFYRKP